AVAGGAVHHACGVDVEHTDVVLVGEGEDGAGGVRAYAGQGEQRLEVVGQHAAMPFDNCNRGPVQVEGAPVVAQAGPGAHDVARRSGRARGGGREQLEEAVVLRDHPRPLRLLQHELADEPRPRVTGVAPGQVAARARRPLDQRRLQQNTSVTYGRANRSPNPDAISATASSTLAFSAA